MTTQAPVSWAVGRYYGLPGSITRYFWVQAVYPSGRSVVSNLIQVANAGSLASGNQINLQWRSSPGAIGYDVVETPTASAPSLNVQATIAVAQGMTDTNLTLSQEPTLQPWTYQTGNGTVGSDITIGTTQVDNGTDGLVLFQAAGLVAEDANLAWDAANGLAVGKPIVATGKVTVHDLEITAGGSVTISTGVGSVKMSTANAATNVAWIPINYNGTVYYVPAFLTNAP